MLHKESMREQDDVLIFERNPVSRLISCAAVFGSAALVFVHIAEHNEVRPLPVLGLALLFIGTVAAAVMQYGDHIFLSAEGVKYENRLLALLGRRGRWILWDDIVEVREVKNRVLVLLSRDGRRVLVDAILGYAIARAEILRRAPQALLTGTLSPDESP